MRLGLKRIHYCLRLMLHLALRHPRYHLGVGLLLFIFFGYFGQNLSQVVAIADQLDPDMSSTHQLKELKSLFGAETSLGFIVQPEKKFFSSNELCLIQEQINEIVFSHGQIDGFMSPYKIRQAFAEEGKLSYRRILPDPCTALSFSENPLAVLSDSPWNSVVTDFQARDFAVSIQMQDLERPGKFGSFDPEAVESLIRSIQEKIPLKIWFTGTSAQQLFTMQGMAQAQSLNIAVIVIICLGFKLLFGTWRAGFLFLGSLIFSATIVFGIMGCLGYAADPLASCLFLMIAVSSVQDFIFLSYDRMKDQASFRSPFRRMLTPGFFTSLTTILGFGSLVISDLQSIRRFGALAATGAFVEWIAVFILLPALMTTFPSCRNWVRVEKAWFLKVSHTVISKVPPRWLIQMSLLVFIAAGFSVGNFRLSQTPSEIFPKDHPFQQGMEYIKQTRGWVADASVVFKPSVNESRQKDIINTLAKNSLVTKTDSFEKVESFILRHIPRASLTEDLVRFELRHSAFYERYHADTGEQRVVIYLQTTDTEKLNQLRHQVESLCPEGECWIAGEYIGFADFSTALIRTLFDSLFLSIILVGSVVFYLSRALGNKHFIALGVSALWGPAWMLVIIYAFDLSVNFITCIVASTLVGLTGDNAIQYMFVGDDLDQGIQDRGIGSIQCALLMALCCLTFTASYFEPPRTLGLLLAGGFIVSLFGDLWVLKALVKKKESF